jgi:hypothetical protein
MLFWRRCRAVRLETEAISHYLNAVPADYRRKRLAEGATVEEVTEEAMEEMDRMLSARLLPGSGTLDKVLRYETHLHRFLMQTIHQLLILQSLRQSRGFSKNGGPTIPDPLKAKFQDDGSHFPGSMRMRGPRPRELRRTEGLLRPPRPNKGAQNGREEEGQEDDATQEEQAGGGEGAPEGALRAVPGGPRLNRAERRRRARLGRRPEGGGEGGRSGPGRT